MTHHIVASWFSNLDWHQLVWTIGAAVASWLAGVFLPPGKNLNKPSN